MNSRRAKMLKPVFFAVCKKMGIPPTKQNWRKFKREMDKRQANDR